MSLAKDLKNVSQDLTVLYVDDDKIVREELKSFLELFFSTVDIAVDGKDGLEHFITNKYDIVITDLTMPIMDGVEMIKEIYKLKPDQHVIITTAHDDSEYLIESINLQVDGFLIKPIDEKKLIRILYKISNVVKNTNLANIKNVLIQKNNFISFKNRLQKNGSGVLILVMIDMLDAIEESYGWEQTQRILIKAYKHIEAVEIKNGNVFNLRRNEFAIYIENGDVVTLHSELYELYSSKHKLKIIQESGTYFNISFSFGVYEGSNINLLMNLNIIFSRMRLNSLCASYKLYNGLEEDIYYNEYLLREITNAIDNSEVKAYFQPMVDCSSYRVYGYEAFARIMIGYDSMEINTFLKSAKTAGVLKDITKSVISSALAELSGDGCKLYINICDNWHDDLEEYILLECERHSFKHERVVLDIGSKIALKSNDSHVQWLVKMKNRGFKIALENFDDTINASTLVLLKPEYIKISLKETDTEEYIHLMLNLARTIGAKSIATGIENKELHDRAISLKFDYAIGYYLGPPESTKRELDHLPQTQSL